MQMADILVNEGYQAAGYNMISLDDCWLAQDRDAQGRLQPDFTRFPSGIHALSSYVSNKLAGNILRYYVVHMIILF